MVIGSAPVSVQGPVEGTWAYALRGIDKQGQHWVRLTLSPDDDDPTEVPKSEWSRFQTDEAFRQAVAGVVEPGTTIVVTSDSVAADKTESITILEGLRQ